MAPPPGSTSSRPRMRPATNQDAPAVRSLVFAVLAEHGLHPDPANTDADLNDLEAHYLARGGTFHVLEGEDGRIIGSVGIYPRGDGVCELRKMYLASTHRHRGLGRALLDQALADARRLRFRRVVLETASVLQAAIRLYARYGFRPYKPEHLVSRCDQGFYLDLP